MGQNIDHFPPGQPARLRGPSRPDDPRVKNILETLNCNRILDLIFVPPEFSTIAAVQEIEPPAAFDKAAIRASVTQAHQALVELNENNAALFSGVIEDLKLPPHS